jgi:C1A family cysteine protease
MDTPKLLDEQEEQDHYRLVDESVKRSAAVLKAIEKRGEAIQRQNPHLPPAPPDPPVKGDLPRTFTWENHGGVTEVKDQNPAGTCWAFAHIGSIEAAYRIRYGYAYDLAEQDLIDCGRDAYRDRQIEGVRFETENPYQKKDAPDAPTPRCKHIRTPFAADGPVYADPNYKPEKDQEKKQPVASSYIKKAIFDHGPAVIEMFIPDTDTVKSAFLHYHGTDVFKEQIPLTYHPSNYKSHIIVVVGWDDDKEAWRIKNSWGTDWADQGYAWIAYGSNKVGMGAYTFRLHLPDLLTSSIWERSNEDEYDVDAWPLAYYQSKNDELSQQGWRVHQLSAGVADGRVLYSTVWRKSQAEEVQALGLKYDDFQQKYNQLWTQGWRINLLTNYVLGNEVYYSATWRKGSGEETRYYGLTYEEFQKKYDELWPKGQRLSILSNVVKDGKVLYQAVWRKGTQAEMQYYHLTYTEFQKKYDQLWKDGWRIYLLQNYRLENKIYFNATWRKGDGGEMQWYGLDGRSYGHKAQAMRKDGWRLRLLDVY